MDAANSLLRDRSLVAFHCTRLTSDEVVDVRKHGLDPLHVDLLARRVGARVAAGDMTKAIGRRLLRKNRARDDNRAGLLWMILTKTTLLDESGVYRLFDYWGGEALYAPHEDDQRMSEFLMTLGGPAIVEASVLVSALRPGRSVGERFVICYLHRRGIETEHDFRFEEPLRVRISGDRIRRVLTTDDDAFFELTGRKRISRIE